MKKIILFGHGEIGEVVDFYLKHDSDFRVEAFTIDQSYIKESHFLNRPLVAFEEIEKKYSPSEFAMLVAVGYSNHNELREQKYYEAKAKGYKLISYVHSKIKLWPNVVHGDNCIIFEDNTIQPFVKVGNNVILWSGNHIGHHATIEDHCFVSSHVVISGGVTVGRNSFLGVNSSVRDHIQIGSHNFVAMGAQVKESTPAHAKIKG